jgi:DNA (cytosine-5)-methyltransferase 1
MKQNPLKILNLYAGIGGNRKLWGNDHEITAVEWDEKIAKIYQDFFPNDKMVVADAHQYLLDHFEEFDFIWSSPPCPTHSQCNNFLHAQGNVRYPDMSLWQEIVFLEKWFKGKWVVENVKSYYPPLWKPKMLDRHYFWSNFPIRPIAIKRDFNIANARATTRQSSKEDIVNLEEYHGIKMPEDAKRKRLLLRNCVNPKIGKHIFQEAFREYKTLL